MVFPGGHSSRNCNKPMDEGSVRGYGYSDNPSFGYGDASGDGNFQVSAAPFLDNPSSGSRGFDDPSSGGGFEAPAAPSWDNTSSGGGFEARAAPSWANPSSGGGGFDDPSSGGGFEVFAASSSESGKKSSIDHVSGVCPDSIVEEL